MFFQASVGEEVQVKVVDELEMPIEFEKAMVVF
jgi:hypothetical protein